MSDTPARPWYKRKRLWLALVVFIAIVAACNNSDDDTSITRRADSAPVQATPTTPEPEPVEAEPVEAEPVEAEPVEAEVNVDDAYIATLDGQGIDYSSEANAITAGHAVCDAFDAGGTMVGIGLTIADSGGYSIEDAGFIMGVAVAAYCPEYTDEFSG